MTPAAGETSRDIQAWDRYWDFGNLHSFSQVAPGNYGGRVAAFWRKHFAELAAGSRILDIATGNGAVPLLALEAGGDFSIHGTDLAAIDPVTRVSDPALRERLQAIHFHPRTPAEELPFAADSFDLVCSQFGLEYSDLERSLGEIARVLAPGGKLALVMHHHRSAAILAARDEIAQADFILDEVRLYLKARNLLRAQADAAGRGKRGTTPPRVAKKQRALAQAIQRIEEAARGTANPRLLLGPLNYVREVLAMNERIGPARALPWLDEAHQRVRAARRRLADMQAAARTDEDMVACTRMLTDAGLAAPDIDVLQEDDGDIVGWQLSTRLTDGRE